MTDHEGIVFPMGRQYTRMKSVRSALRNGEILKDNYERLSCANCEKNLKTENPPDELYQLKVCPECGRKWKQLG